MKRTGRSRGGLETGQAGHLDEACGSRRQLVDALIAYPGTIVLVTHESDIAQHAERVIIFRDGLMVEDHAVTDRTLVDKGTL